MLDIRKHDVSKLARQMFRCLGHSCLDEYFMWWNWGLHHSHAFILTCGQDASNISNSITARSFRTMAVILVRSGAGMLVCECNRLDFQIFVPRFQALLIPSKCHVLKA
jgi:hypothetical protein